MMSLLLNQFEDRLEEFNEFHSSLESSDSRVNSLKHLSTFGYIIFLQIAGSCRNIVKVCALL